MIYLDLVLNLTLLVALSVVSAFIDKRWSRQTRASMLLQGALFGAAAVIGMLKPVDFGSGIIFDGRSVMISLCALFFGFRAGALAAAMAIVCRIALGGGGMLTGVLVILSSVLIGLLAHRRLKPDISLPSTAHLYLFGIAVHLAMLALLFTLPGGAGLTVVKKIGPAIMLLYPLATILSGTILADQLSSFRVLAELRASETLFRTLFEGHMAVKLIIDPGTGAIVDANKAAEDYYGWTKAELKSMRIQDINTLSPEELAREMKNVRNRKRVHFEFRHRQADGSVRDVAVFSSKIVVKGRELLHSIIHDVTEQKETQRLLQEKEVKYRELFDNAPVGIFSTTSGGRPLTLNAAMAALLGCASPREAMERFSDLLTQLFVSPQSHDRFLGLLREKGRVENFECRAQTGDGREIWLRIHARIARQAEDDFVIEGFTTDITAQRKLEEQFRQAQKMESVGRLAGGVAHDYNNMLSVILGYTELALDRVSPADPLHADLQEVYKAATRSTEVTRQLLAFARKQAIAPKILDLNETVAGMLKMLRRLIGEDIDLAWRPGEGLCPVRMDPSQIDQILVNLCVNARDAIAGVGRITIETGRTAIDQAYCDDHEGFTPGDFVVLAVCDDGCGMSREARERLFEPFFTTKEVGKGTGLGLATVYGIVKQNRGCINVYSEPGNGTIFRIYLPCHGETAAVAGILSPAPVSGGQGETILVVEDEAAILTMSTTMLQRLGYAVLPAGSIDEAIRLAREHGGKIHLLITDVIMPDMNGRDLADRLHDLYPDLKILFMSGYTANVIAHHGVLDPDVCFIQKPFSIKELAAKVREALARPS